MIKTEVITELAVKAAATGGTKVETVTMPRIRVEVGVPALDESVSVRESEAELETKTDIVIVIEIVIENIGVVGVPVVTRTGKKTEIRGGVEVEGVDGMGNYNKD